MGVGHLRSPELIKRAQRARDVTLVGVGPIILCLFSLPHLNFSSEKAQSPSQSHQARVPVDTHPSKTESGFSCRGVNPGQSHQLRSRLQFC